MQKTRLAVLIPLSLLAFLTLQGCTRYVPVPVDSELTRPLNKPGLEGDTWRDLLESYVQRGATIDQCNERLGAIAEAGK